MAYPFFCCDMICLYDPPLETNGRDLQIRLLAYCCSYLITLHSLLILNRSFYEFYCPRSQHVFPTLLSLWKWLFYWISNRRAMFALRMKEASTSGMSVGFYQTTRPNVRKHGHLHTLSGENLKSHHCSVVFDIYFCAECREVPLKTPYFSPHPVIPKLQCFLWWIHFNFIL